MGTKTIKKATVADAYLELLADRGIDYFFGNAGTDFAPIIEGFAKAAALGIKVPQPVTVPHENVAINMALGYYVVSGRPQVVMVHVNVGTTNAMCGLVNAAKGNLPVIFSSGRTPFAEYSEAEGRRSREIHWPQEMFDQGSMLREFVKWDFELKSGDMLETAVDRSINMAMSEPRGPVYLALPREPLAQKVDNFTYTSPSRLSTPSAPHPDSAAVDQAAELLAKAENPLIITADAGRDPAAMEPLGRLASRFAIPVSQRKPHFLNLTTDHEMHFGYDPDPMLDSCDVILVVDCDVPWIPSVKEPESECRIIHIGSDPLYSSYPIRGYTADLAITGITGVTLGALDAALESREKSAKERIDTRRKRITAARQEMHTRWAANLDKVKDESPIHSAWVSHCLDRIKGEDAIVIKESPVMVNQMHFTKPGTMIGGGAGGGLGYGLGMALGAKMAAPDKLVICTQGDGAYMFGNPVPAHYVARAEDLPILTVVFNNEHWGAVKRNTRAMYPDGYAAKSNREPLTFFEPDSGFEHAAEVAGGYGEKVTVASELPGALERALNAIENEGRQALLNVICS